MRKWSGAFVGGPGVWPGYTCLRQSFACLETPVQASMRSQSGRESDTVRAEMRLTLAKFTSEECLKSSEVTC